MSEHKSVTYKDEETTKFALETIEQINNDLEAREEASIVFNGIPYTEAYEYNQQKAINYAPPKKDDEHQVSSGLVHEKIISFVSIFLKYVFKYDIKVYKDGQLIPRMGDVYELGIEHSRKLENFKFKVALIYWELFSQGDAFILEDWMVKNDKQIDAMKDGDLVTPDTMDYTYEYVEELTFEEGEMFQTRRAESVVLDGRRVILGDNECNILQDQPRITIEEKMSRGEAEKVFSSLTMWEQVPDDMQQILAQAQDKLNTLFNEDRLEDAKKHVLVHRYFDKENNKFNIFVNGVMMLPKDTPLTLFYPRGNYPISQASCERITGSAYSRSVPAKTKFNDDFLTWMLKKMAEKFAQGIEPAILAKGNYTLTADMFKPRQITHNVESSDFEKVDPDNKGVTAPEFNFYSMTKDILESQTVNQTTSGEIDGNATATEIATVDQNQQVKLAFILDAIMLAWYDMAYRRCETIESKYTIKQDEEEPDTTEVDGKTINVYSNFTFARAGIQNMVIFDDQLSEKNESELANQLFMQSAESKKGDTPVETYLVDPLELRQCKYMLDINVKPEKVKDSQLQLIQMFDELNQTISIFGRSDQGGSVNIEEVKKDYLEVSGKSDDFFVSSDLAQDPELVAALKEEDSGYDMGSLGKPRVSDALAQNARGNK